MINYVFCQQLVVTLAHFLWQASLVGAIAYGLNHMFRHHAPTYRYAVHTVALFSLPLIVLTTFMLIGEPSRTATDSAWSVAPQPNLTATEPAAFSFQPETQLPSTAPSLAAQTPIERSSDAVIAIGPNEVFLTLAPWIVGIYFIGVLVCFFRLCLAVRGGSSLKKTSKPLHDPVLIRILNEQTARIGLKLKPALRFCERVVAPTVVGIIKPTILLPPSLMTGLGPEQLSAIISHELAHIRRHDLLMNMIQRMIESILFFHPVVWMLSRQMNKEREACCDDLALTAGHDKLLYADSLLKMAELSFGCDSGTTTDDFSMAASGRIRSDLEFRIHRLLNPLSDSRMRLTQTGWTALLAVAFFLPVLCLAFQWPVNAKEPTDNPSQPVAQVATENSELSDNPQIEEQTDVDPATRLGRAIHERMAAIDRLPKFYLTSNEGALGDFFLKNPSDDPLENLIRSLDADSPDGQWYRHHQQLGWDENHFVTLGGDEEIPQHVSSWGTREIAGGRVEQGPHYLYRDVTKIWDQCTPPDYIMASRHKFWFGESSSHNILIGTGVPPNMVSYERLADMKFDGELCQVVRSKARHEMLIISKASGLLRGYVLIEPKRYAQLDMSNIPDSLQSVLKEITGVEFSTTEEYYEWFRKNEANITAQIKWELTAAWSVSDDWSDQTAYLLVRFRDYREIAPGITWPFREDRVQTMAMHNGKFLCSRTYVDVKEIRFDQDLTDKVNSMRPKEGEQVEDGRFGTIARYKFSKDRTNEEIMKIADIAKAKQVKEQLENERLFEGWKKQRADFEEMIGKPAPILPAKGWVGGERPKLEGKPYLIHFWSTRYRPHKNEWPILKQLVEAGATVVGAHRNGTSSEDVSAAIKAAKLPYSTYLSPNDESADSSTIAGFPAKYFSYCVLVDGKGIVVAHGTMADNAYAVLEKFRSLAKVADEGFMWETPPEDKGDLSSDIFVIIGEDAIIEDAEKRLKKRLKEGQKK